MIYFTLSHPTPLLNVTQRQHWAVRRRAQEALAWEIRGQTPSMPQPFPRAVVTIERRSTRVPDRDNMIGGCKGLVDILKPASERNPFGLGFIVDDDPAHVTVEYRALKVRKNSEMGTTVRIEGVDQ